MMANASNITDVYDETKWLDTDIAIVFLIFCAIICLANEFLLYLHTKMLPRQEDLLIEKLLMCYGKFNIVCTPIVVVLLYGVIGLLPIPTIFGEWFCDISFFVVFFWHYFNGSFSLILVCLIYVCFVHNNKATYHGKEFIVNLFCALSFVIPLICTLISMVLSKLLTMEILDQGWSYWATDKCYGTNEDTNTEFCFVNETLLRQKYGEWSDIANTCIQIACWIEVTLQLLLSSNILDGFIYCLIYSHLRR